MSEKNQKDTLNVDEALVQSEAFFIKNKKKLLIGLGVVAAVVALCVGGYFYLKSQNEKAQELIAQGMPYLQQGDYQKALKGDGKTFPGFPYIADKFTCTDGANTAKALAGMSYAHDNKFKEAIKYLEDFDPKGDNSLSPATLGTLANCYASNNQVDKAIETFKEAAKLADNNAMSPQFLLQAGILLESQKKNAEAKELYEQIKKDYPTSALAAPQPMQDGTIADPYIERYIQRVSQ